MTSYVPLSVSNETLAFLFNEGVYLSTGVMSVTQSLCDRWTRVCIKVDFAGMQSGILGTSLCRQQQLPSSLQENVSMDMLTTVLSLWYNVKYESAIHMHSDKPLAFIASILCKACLFRRQ